MNEFRTNERIKKGRVDQIVQFYSDSFILSKDLLN